MKLAVTLLTSTLLTTSAFALTQRIKLDMNSIHLRGQETIGIKRQINSQMGFKVKGWSLKSVKLLAKSKKGMGKASVFAGGNEGMQSTITGTPNQFQSYNEGFYTVNLQVPHQYRGAGKNPFQVWTQGNIKVKNMTIFLKKSLNPRLLNIGRLPLTMVAKLKPSKVISSKKTIKPHGIVRGIAFTGLKGKVQINKVVVFKQNGQKIILDEVRGSLKSGKTKGLIFPRGLQAGIVKIEVTATSNNIFGGRGKFAIKLAQ